MSRFLTEGKLGSLASLILGDFVGSVGIAFSTEGLSGLGTVDLKHC